MFILIKVSIKLKMLLSEWLAVNLLPCLHISMSYVSDNAYFSNFIYWSWMI